MEDQRNNKELINQIREGLYAYEEPYQEGAWEEFSGNRKSVPLFTWKWLAAASVILILGTVWILSDRQPVPSKQNQVVKQKSNKDSNAIFKPKEEQETIFKDVERYSDVQKKFNLAGSIALGLKNKLKNEKADERLETIQPDISVENVMPPIALNTNAKNRSEEVKPSTTTDDPEKKVSGFMDFLNDEVKNNKESRLAKVKQASKWDFGIEILPTVSNSAVNVGAGLTTEYKVSDHFSVGSGISFVDLQAGKALTPGVSLLSSKQLQSVDANIRGIDIPINLVYNINKNLYTSIGVSYFNVIQEDRKNTYVAEKQVSAMAVDPVTGAAATLRTFVSETTQEPGNENPLNGNSYLGFFNFSVGRKQQVFKKYNIHLEPFIKVPVGKLSQQELKLMNGGMKFKIDF